MKKFLALAIALLMVMPLAVACTPDGDPSVTTQTPGAEENPDNGETTTTGGSSLEGEPEESTTEILPELPDEKVNTKVTVLTRGGDWSAWDIVFDTSDSPMVVDTLNNSLKTRNDAILEKYGIEIQQIVAPGSVKGTAENKLLSNTHEYDIILPTIIEAGQLAQQGLLIPTQELEFVDTTKPWYDQRCLDELQINGKSYFFFSDITAVNLDAIWVYFFNHALIELYGLEDPYELVADYEWTFDKMLEMCAAATPKDADGVPTKSDYWGIVGHDYVITSVYIGSGEKVATANANGEIALTMNNNSGRVVNIMSKLISLKPYWCRYALTSSKYSSDYGTPERYGFEPEDNYNELVGVFTSGHALFMGEVLSTLRTDHFVEAELAIGVLPTPMFDSTQGEEYYCAVNGVAPAMSIPYTTVDTRTISIVIEAWAAESHKTLLPAYYENCMTTRYAKDTITPDILDMIFDSRTYDLGIYYAWGELSNRFTALTYAGKTDFSSMYRRHRGAAQSQIERFTEDFS